MSVNRKAFTIASSALMAVALPTVMYADNGPAPQQQNSSQNNESGAEQSRPMESNSHAES